MANFGEILNNIAIGASQSVRRNAGDTAFEAFTPGSGGGGGSSDLVLFTNFTDASNTGTAETDLYSSTLAANTFDVDGSMMRIVYAINGTSAVSLKDFKVYIAGTVVLDGTSVFASGIADTAYVDVSAIRASSTTLRVTAKYMSGVSGSVAAYTDITSLTFSNTIVVKITGKGSASNQVVAKFAKSYITNATSTNYLTSGTVTSFTAQQNFASNALTDGATINWNLNTQQVAHVTLGGNRTLANPTNMVNGGTYILRVVQDGTGTRTLAYGTAYKWPGGTAPVLSTAAGAVDLITFVSDGTNMYGVIQKGFA